MICKLPLLIDKYHSECDSSKDEGRRKSNFRGGAKQRKAQSTQRKRARYVFFINKINLFTPNNQRPQYPPWVCSESLPNQAIISHADALASNSSLKELELDLCNYSSGVTSEGYAALTRMLCNSSSIVSTYHSNHTTEKLCSLSDECKLPEEVKTFLRLNKENSKSQAARIKIIKTHLSGCEINMQPFVNMELSIHPHANAWMARD